MPQRTCSAPVRGSLDALLQNGVSGLSESGVTSAYPSLRSPSTSRHGQFRRWCLAAPDGSPDGGEEDSTQIWLRSQDAVGTVLGELHRPQWQEAFRTGHAVSYT